MSGIRQVHARVRLLAAAAGARRRKTRLAARQTPRRDRVLRRALPGRCRRRPGHRGLSRATPTQHLAEQRACCHRRPLGCAAFGANRVRTSSLADSASAVDQRRSDGDGAGSGPAGVVPRQQPLLPAEAAPRRRPTTDQRVLLKEENSRFT